jgi:hypothetical protein
MSLVMGRTPMLSADAANVEAVGEAALISSNGLLRRR